MREDEDDRDMNGGPSHLAAWRKRKGWKGIDLAKASETSQSMITDLERGKKKLTAKWLRKLAPLLDTTPGLLLDHDPAHIDADLIKIWVNATDLERQQIVGSALAIVRRRVVGE